jgi:hypothetical protein
MRIQYSICAVLVCTLQPPTGTAGVWDTSQTWTYPHASLRRGFLRVAQGQVAIPDELRTITKEEQFTLQPTPANGQRSFIDAYPADPTDSRTTLEISTEHIFIVSLCSRSL